MNSLASIARTVVVAMLALAGLAMAFVLMLSTAIALGVMYVVARVRGRPFPLAQMWQAQRGTQWSFVRPGAGPFGSSPVEDVEIVTPGPAAAQRPRALRADHNVTDVQARDIG